MNDSNAEYMHSSQYSIGTKKDKGIKNMDKSFLQTGEQVRYFSGQWQILPQRRVIALEEQHTRLFSAVYIHIHTRDYTSTYTREHAYAIYRGKQAQACFLSNAYIYCFKSFFLPDFMCAYSVPAFKCFKDVWISIYINKYKLFNMREGNRPYLTY